MSMMDITIFSHEGSIWERDFIKDIVRLFLRENKTRTTKARAQEYTIKWCLMELERRAKWFLGNVYDCGKCALDMCCGMIEFWYEILITEWHGNLRESANRQLLYNVRYNTVYSSPREWFQYERNCRLNGANTKRLKYEALLRPVQREYFLPHDRRAVHDEPR